MQVQIDTFGTYGVFVTLDNTLVDSLDLEKSFANQGFFSPGGGFGIYSSLQKRILCIHSNMRKM